MVLQRVCRWGAYLFSGIVLTFSSFAMIGWITDRSSFTRFFLPFEGVPFNAAFALVLLSVNTFLVQFQTHKYISRALSGIVFLIAMGTFIKTGYFHEVDDTPLAKVFFFREMSPGTLVCFMLLPAALVLYTIEGFKENYRGASFLATLAFSFALIAIIIFALGYSKELGWLDGHDFLVNLCILSSSLAIVFSAIYKDVNYQRWYFLQIGISYMAITFALWGFLSSRKFFLIDGMSSHELLINYIYGILIVLLMIAGSIFLKKTILSMDDLVKAKALFEETSETKERLLRYISHEIRNPLAAIEGYAGPLTETQDLNQVKEMVEGIISSSRHLKNIVEDLLATSRYESGKLELQVEERPFMPWIEDLCNILKNQCARKEIEFERMISEKRPALVVLDINKVSQIIINFVSNAIKHTPGKGKITLNIEFSIDPDQGRIMHVSVSDTGEGIPVDQQQKLFRPFSQARTKDKIIGIGLGLTVCKTFVEMMGGKIGFTSDSSKGTKFYFSIHW